MSAVAFDQLVFQRRSIRRYKDEALPESWIHDILACALQAPSPSNSQPVRFVQICSQACKDRLQQALITGYECLLAQHRSMNAPARVRNWINAYRRYSEFMFAAPVLLAVAVSRRTQTFSQRLAESGFTFPHCANGAEMDITVGLALQNILLRAQALGVGSCVLTAPLIFIQNVEEFLNIPDLAVKCFVTLGWADESPRATDRRSLTQMVQVI